AGRFDTAERNRIPMLPRIRKNFPFIAIPPSFQTRHPLPPNGWDLQLVDLQSIPGELGYPQPCKGVRYQFDEFFLTLTLPRRDGTGRQLSRGIVFQLPGVYPSGPSGDRERGLVLREGKIICEGLPLDLEPLPRILGVEGKGIVPRGERLDRPVREGRIPALGIPLLMNLESKDQRPQLHPCRVLVPKGNVDFHRKFQLHRVPRRPRTVKDCPRAGNQIRPHALGRCHRSPVTPSGNSELEGKSGWSIGFDSEEYRLVKGIIRDGLDPHASSRREGRFKYVRRVDEGRKPAVTGGPPERLRQLGPTLMKVGRAASKIGFQAEKIRLVIRVKPIALGFGHQNLVRLLQILVSPEVRRYRGRKGVEGQDLQRVRSPRITEVIKDAFQGKHIFNHRAELRSLTREIAAQVLVPCEKAGNDSMVFEKALRPLLYGFPLGQIPRSRRIQGRGLQPHGDVDDVGEEKLRRVDKLGNRKMRGNRFPGEVEASSSCVRKILEEVVPIEGLGIDPVGQCEKS